MANLSPARLVAVGAGAALFALLSSPFARADVDTAYGDLTILYSDASAFSNAFGTYEDLLFDSDLSQNFLAASGIGLGLSDPFPSDATASQDLSSIAAEGNTITSQLAAL